MKADVWQQHSLAKLAELDAELSRLAHRGTHLSEQQRYDAVHAEYQAATDRAAVLQIAIDDVDGQVTRLESEIDGVRQREDRDRGLLSAATTSSKQLTELQHELGTLERRQSSLEDSLLEIMERREELAGQQSGDAAEIARLEGELATARQERDAALTEVDQARVERTERRAGLAAELDANLLAAYERQRTATGIGAGLLQGRRCGACRIEIDHGEMSRIAAAAEDEVLRCPECNTILLRVQV